MSSAGRMNIKVGKRAREPRSGANSLRALKDAVWNAERRTSQRAEESALKVRKTKIKKGNV